MTLPLGERESQSLEFKGRDALSDPKQIGAEVVAFLNCEGGDLWIGLRDESDRAVEIEGIEDVAREIRDLTNFLVDTIEPAPPPQEIEVRPVSAGSEGSVIRVRLQRGQHRPYALKGAHGARRFYTRIGTRIRSMSREELAAAFSGAGGDEDPAQEARRTLIVEREELQKSGRDWFWIGIQPVRNLRLDIQDPALESYLTYPETIGVPLDRPSFHVPFEPELKQGRLVAWAIPVAGGDLVKETVLREDGGIRFRSVLHLLYYHGSRTRPGVISPDVLSSVPLSLFRLASAALEDEMQSTDRVVVDIALLGLGRDEVRLLPGRAPLPERQAGSFGQDEEDLTLIEPLVFTFSEVAETPGRCVFRLLRPVYESFGLREDSLPADLDPSAGRRRILA